MRDDDRIRLQQMLDAAQEAIAFAQGKRRSDLDGDRLLTLALVKSIEIVGEAASKVSIECRNACAEVPWQNIIGMRNRLIHAYFDINLDTVWSTVTQDLSPVIDELKRIIDQAV